MILTLFRCRIMSMLYIFKIPGDFANIFFKKCCQIFRYHEIWQHPLGFTANSTNFDSVKTQKCWQNPARTKNCTTFSIILQTPLYIVTHLSRGNRPTKADQGEMLHNFGKLRNFTTFYSSSHIKSA